MPNLLGSMRAAIDKEFGQPKDGLKEALAASHARLDRHKSWHRRITSGKTASGESLSRDIADVAVVPMEDVVLDPKFENSREALDPRNLDWTSSEGMTMEQLRESMASEGLKVPIAVWPSPSGDRLFLRQGFRRWTCAKELGWKEIPAAIWPEQMSEEDQYLGNILENTVRKTLSTYELATSARRMRDKFGYKAVEFARKAGLSESYVSNLLRCLDRLPPDLIDQWREGARLSFDQWVTLSHFDHDNAMRTFRRMVGLRAREAELDEHRPKRRGPFAPARFLARMQKLYFGLEGSDLDPRTRSLALKIVEYCMGSLDSIPGVYDPKKEREYRKRADLRRELELPLPDEGDESDGSPDWARDNDEEESLKIGQKSDEETREKIPSRR